MKKATTILIDGIREWLKAEGIYKGQDETTLLLLAQTYEQYQEACKKVKQMGAVLETLDYNENKQYKTNPWTYVQQDLKKDLFKLLEGFYLNPKTRQSLKGKATKKVKDSRFNKMMLDLN